MEIGRPAAASATGDAEPFSPVTVPLIGTDSETGSILDPDGPPHGSPDEKEIAPRGEVQNAGIERPTISLTVLRKTGQTPIQNTHTPAETHGPEVPPPL